jgi:hypothetical protein
MHNFICLVPLTINKILSLSHGIIEGDEIDLSNIRPRNRRIFRGLLFEHAG